MKKLIAFFTLIFIAAISFAQDSTDTTGGGSGGGFSLPSGVVLILSIALALYEVIVRFMPTVKNYSIIGWVIKLIQTVLPNKSTTKTDHP